VRVGAPGGRQHRAAAATEHEPEGADRLGDEPADIDHGKRLQKGWWGRAAGRVIPVPAAATPYAAAAVVVNRNRSIFSA
jgi:hypothetical protein